MNGFTKFCNCTTTYIKKCPTYLLIFSHQHTSNGSQVPSTEVGILNILMSGWQNQCLKKELLVQWAELARTLQTYGTVWLPEIMQASALKSGSSQRHKESEDGELRMLVWGRLAGRSLRPMQSGSTRPHPSASLFSETPTRKSKTFKHAVLIWSIKCAIAV